ncbi:hypothetical protein ACWEC4_40700 [Streptomyces sp. NPDC005055]
MFLQAAGVGGPRSPDGADLFVGGLVGQVRGTEVAAGGRVVDLDPVVVVRMKRTRTRMSAWPVIHGPT